MEPGLPLACTSRMLLSKLKDFRRVATRYEKTAASFLSVVTLAATVLWLR
jgi:transposase